jgi:hypothetical protein
VIIWDQILYYEIGDGEDRDGDRRAGRIAIGWVIEEIGGYCREGGCYFSFRDVFQCFCPGKGGVPAITPNLKNYHKPQSQYISKTQLLQLLQLSNFHDPLRTPIPRNEKNRFQEVGDIDREGIILLLAF